jgi:hypothetical protein
MSPGGGNDSLTHARVIRGQISTGTGNGFVRPRRLSRH